MYCEKGLKKPSAEDWLVEAKKSESAGKIGMYLVHNGVVRATPKKDIYQAEQGGDSLTPGQEQDDHQYDIKTKKIIVKSMNFSADMEKANRVFTEGLKLPGIYYLRVWLAEGTLSVGDDIMQVLIGADCRPNCVNALETIVGRLKNECVFEEEIYE